MAFKHLSLALGALVASAAYGADVPQLGTDATRTFTTVATQAQGLRHPMDLEFNPDAPNELWTVNSAINGTVILQDAGTAQQTADRRVDSHAGHFMNVVSSLAFGDRTFRNGMTFATCQESRNGGNDFMGPTLWPADLSVYARANQGGPLLGSHIDMLHQSPLCMGIAHEDGNAYWVADGRNGHIVRYDFATDHGPGHDDHANGIVRRYPEAKFSRVEKVPGHLHLDKISGWLYVADTGTGRVYRLDTRSGASTRRLNPRNEPLAEYSEWTGATIEVLLEGLSRPAGIVVDGDTLFVGLNGTGEILAYDLATGTELDRVDTGARGLAGLAIGPDGKLWYVDALDQKVVRLNP